MCRTCEDLPGFQLCPPRRAVREPDFDDELEFEREVFRLGTASTGGSGRVVVDATRELVLRSHLLARDERH